MERASQVDDALTQALAAWERGEDWEKLMADASPAVKEGLHRDMAAVLALRQDLPEPDPRAEARSRAAWMAAGAQQRARRQIPAAADTPARRWWAGGVFRRPRLAWLAAGLAAWLALGGGAVWAAEGSLPGDGLYPIKTWRYEVLVALARSPASRLKAMQVQEDSYRRDCLAVLALGREVEVEFFGRLEAVEGSTWRIGGLPVDVSGADLSAVLVSARPLEGRRLLVDARTEKGRVIGLRVSPAQPLPGDSEDKGSTDAAKGGPDNKATATATAPATATATGPAPTETLDAAAAATGATGGAAGIRAPDRGATTRPAAPAIGEGSDDAGAENPAGDDDKSGDQSGDDKGGGADSGGDDKGGDDKGGGSGSDDKGGDKEGGDSGGDDQGGDDKGGGSGGDDKGGDDKGGDSGKG